MSGAPHLDRRAAVTALLRERDEALVISSLGAPTYDLAAAGDSDRNFYLWGGMGGAMAMGLGLALARPERPVMVIAGDGEALMGMGSFATIAMQAPPNLSIVILDNGLYGETGGQASHTSTVLDLAAVAAASGIRESLTIQSLDDVTELNRRVMKPNGGPLVAVIKISAEEVARVLPSRDGVMLKARFRAGLDLPSM